jgi:glycyl-tRNA synthetase beta subunit
MGVRKIEVSTVGENLEKLHDNFVIADPEKRRRRCWQAYQPSRRR